MGWGEGGERVRECWLWKVSETTIRSRAYVVDVVLVVMVVVCESVYVCG